MSRFVVDTDTCSSLQAKQQELERQLAADNLRKGLEHRPDREDLVNRASLLVVRHYLLLIISGNILPDSNAAPSLQASQRALDKSMRTDALEQKLQRRPTVDELVKEGILEPGEKP